MAQPGGQVVPAGHQREAGRHPEHQLPDDGDGQEAEADHRARRDPPRIPTKPGRAAKERRIASKKVRGQAKRDRNAPLDY